MVVGVVVVGVVVVGLGVVVVGGGVVGTGRSQHSAAILFKEVSSAIQK